MKNFFKKIAVVAAVATIGACFALTGCSGGVACLGSWTKVSDAVEWANNYAFDTDGDGAKDYYIASINSLPMASCDTVTLFDDGSFIWATDSTLGYTTDGASYFSPLTEYTAVVYGTYSMTEDADMECYNLTIDSVTRVTATGSGDGPKVDFDTDVPSDAFDETAMSAYCDRMLTLLRTDVDSVCSVLLGGSASSVDTYELDYYGKLTGTSLSLKIWFAYVGADATF